MRIDEAQKLLQDIDAIECEMRRLEGRLTSIRRRIHERAFGKNTNIDINGYPKEQAERPLVLP